MIVSNPAKLMSFFHSVFCNKILKPSDDYYVQIGFHPTLCILLLKKTWKWPLQLYIDYYWKFSKVIYKKQAPLT